MDHYRIQTIDGELTIDEEVFFKDLDQMLTVSGTFVTVPAPFNFVAVACGHPREPHERLLCCCLISIHVFDVQYNICTRFCSFVCPVCANYRSQCYCLLEVVHAPLPGMWQCLCTNYHSRRLLLACRSAWQALLPGIWHSCVPTTALSGIACFRSSCEKTFTAA